MADISNTLIAKSDQLNADDLITGPITVQITGVSVTNAEQPVVVSITGGHQPWKPGKTMRRILSLGWGTETNAWIGKWVTLFRDASITFGKETPGGIRIAAMSDIRARIDVKLALTKGGKKAQHQVEILKPPTNGVMKTTEFQAACNDAIHRGWTPEQIKAVNGGKAADVPAERRRELADVLAGAPPQQTTQPATSAELSDDDKAAIIAAEKAENA